LIKLGYVRLERLVAASPYELEHVATQLKMKRPHAHTLKQACAGYQDREAAHATLFNIMSPWSKHTRDRRSYYFNSKTKAISLEPPSVGVNKHKNPYANTHKFEEHWTKLMALDHQTGGRGTSSASASGGRGGGGGGGGARTKLKSAGAAARLASALSIDVTKAAELLELYGSHEAAVAFHFASDVATQQTEPGPGPEPEPGPLVPSARP
jgi:hypothetical protein